MKEEGSMKTRLVIVSSMKVTNKMQLNMDNLLFLVSSTGFGQCFRPASGALVSIYSIW